MSWIAGFSDINEPSWAGLQAETHDSGKKWLKAWAEWKLNRKNRGLAWAFGSAFIELSKLNYLFIYF